jgi:hypothetical protein
MVGANNDTGLGRVYPGVDCSGDPARVKVAGMRDHDPHSLNQFFPRRE